MVWLKFIACAALIGGAGWMLTRSGDVIAEKMGLSRGWIGLILLASVTSLPELVTGASGSCVFNLALLVVLDFLHRGETFFRRAAQGHILSAGFGILLIGFVGLNLLLREHGFNPVLGHIGLYTPIIAVLYVVAVRAVFVYERRTSEASAEARYPGLTLRAAVTRFFISGWDRTFVGTILVAAVTSMPEAAVTIAALRIGALDMAIANLLGSNLSNMLIIAVDDVLFRNGPILSHVSPMHGVSAVSAMIMTGLVIVGLLYRPKARLFRTLGWISFGLFAIYMLNAYVLYLGGG
jgi:cation:H+ antiporter